MGSERVLLLKPTTFMNDSGRSLAEAGRFYKIDVASFIVIHDELDLEPAKLRVKVGGGNAGHNGLRSITALCGNDYKRVRLGIGHPGDRTLVYNYVLSDFARDERPWVTTLCDSVAKDAALLVKGEDATFQNKVFGAMKAAGLRPPNATPDSMLTPSSPVEHVGCRSARSDEPRMEWDLNAASLACLMWASRPCSMR